MQPDQTQERAPEDASEVIAAQIAAIAAGTVERMNVDFEDSVVFLGRVLGERPAATSTTIVAVDRHGLDMVVTDPSGAHSRRVEFATEVTAPHELLGAVMALVISARGRSGEPGETSAEQQMRIMQGVRTMLTEVVAVEQIHPHLRRITFAGGDLDTFRPLGPDTFLYVLLPPPGRTELTIDRSFTWDAYAEMAADERPVGAYYTVRTWDDTTKRLEMLFVLHGDDGEASAWAGRACVGDPVALWGPRTAFAPPPQTDWYLLVADETGLPAVASILESMPVGMPAVVVAEVASAEEQQDLHGPAANVIWMYRDGAEAGTTSLLLDRIRHLRWPGGTPYVWGGGESRAMTAVRRHVRDVIGLPREAVSLVGYWRHSTHGPDSDDDSERGSSAAT